MRQDQILTPMGALALLTFLVLLFIPYHRVRAGLAGKINRDDFKYGESSNVPGHVSIPNRNMMNLLELPLLFYVICLMFFAAGRVDQTAIGLAWTYVGFRAAHSAVHLTYNDVMHRLTLFSISNFVLIGMWVLFFFKGY